MDKVLIAGAGAVGAVYGRHLQQGGSNVTFFVKEKYSQPLSTGIRLYNYNQKKDGLISWTEFSTLSKAADVSAGNWDFIYLTMSSTALRSDLSLQMLKALNKEAVIVVLQAGQDDYEFVRSVCPENQVVEGLITIVSYQAPLEGESLEPCIAYWFPPGSPGQFCGEEEAVNKILTVFKNGGMPAARTDSVRRLSAFATGYFMPFLAALEASDWSFKKLRKGRLLSVVDTAAAEAWKITAANTGMKRPLNFMFLKAPLVQLATLANSMVVPFDLEVYFKYHFTKVKDQTVFYLNRFIENGKQHSLRTDALQRLTSMVD